MSSVWFVIWSLREMFITIFNIRGAFNKFSDFFVQAFKIVVHSWKFTMLLLYIIWDDWPISMISGSNEQLHQQLEYTLLKPDCHSWWISKMQSGREDDLEEGYAIKFFLKLGKKMPQKRTECFRLFDHLAWIEHEFLGKAATSYVIILTCIILHISNSTCSVNNNNNNSPRKWHT